MAEVDRLMMDVFGIELLQMMENAGRNLADCAQNLTEKHTRPKFLILCGSGNNGGGGMVAARHLINRGFPVNIVLMQNETQLKQVPKRQWTILKNMGTQAVIDPIPEKFDLIIDAMVGYGLQGAPRGAVGDWINKINASPTPILSLDVPSGLDATQGIPFDPCTRASATLTLALPKTGLKTSEAKPYVGDLYLADISVPERVYEMLGLNVGPIFEQNRIIKL
jgi:NAD(P)H-hydrate epimerase